MLEPVPLRVGLGRQPEVAREIHDPHPGLEQRGHERRAGPVREGAEREPGGGRDRLDVLERREHGSASGGREVRLTSASVWPAEPCGRGR